MKKITLYLLLIILSSPFAVMAESAFEQKQALILKLIASQSTSQKTEIIKAVAEVVQLQTMAAESYAQGEIPQASQQQNAALSKAIALRKRYQAHGLNDERNLAEFKRLLAASQAYLSILKDEYKQDKELIIFSDSLERLSMKVSPSLWSGSWDEMNSTHNQLAFIVSRVLDNQERVVELNLDTPIAQYEYELRIFKGLMMFVDKSEVQLTNKQEGKLRQMVSDAQKLKEHATNQQQNQDVTQAVDSMEEANIMLKRALRILGVILP